MVAEEGQPEMRDPGPVGDRPSDVEVRANATTWKDRAGSVLRGAALVAALFFAVLAIRGQHKPLEEGQPAPPLALVSYDGQAWDLSRFEGRPVVVNFWGTWCPPCLQELPHFARAAKDYADDVVFIGPSVNSPAEDVFRIIERFGVTYPVARVDAQTSSAWNARSLPSTYVLDASHRVVWSGSGALTRSDLEGLLESYLGIPPKGS